MSDHRFLELLRAVELLRRIEERQSMNITSEHLDRAAATEVLKSAHPPHRILEPGNDEPCPECEVILAQQIALREQMHSQGITFPTGMLGS